MAFPCPDDCPDGVPYLDWIAYSQIYQEYLTYCALATAAANSPGPGPFMFRGYYEVTTDDDYVAPEDASVIFWNVPAQAGARTITFTGPVGQYTAVVVIDSNGEDVIESGSAAFTLNDAAQRWALVGMTDVPGTVVTLYGTAGGYNVGTSGTTLPLNDANITRSGTLTQTANVILDRSVGARLEGATFANPPYIIGIVVPGSGWDIASNSTTMLRSIALGLYGTSDQLFQGITDGTSYTVLETGNNLGLILGTYTDVPVSVRPNRSIAADFTDNGTLIATAGTGGTRIAKMLAGKGILVAGSVTVADAFVTANSIITCSPEGAGAGHLNYTISAGVSFTISSSDGADTRVVSYRREVPA